jgi:hypothetical protein
VTSAAAALRWTALADEALDSAPGPVIAALAEEDALEGAARVLPVALLALELGDDLARAVPAPALAALLRR